MSKFYSILIVFLLVVLGTIGDFYMKLAGKEDKFIDWKLFLFGSIAWGLTIPGWFLAMKYMKLATAGVLYSLFIVIFSVSLGYFYFRESLNPYEIIGVISAVISLLLLSRFA